MTHRDDFLRGYVEAMLWANTHDGNGEPIENAQYAYVTPGEWWTDTPVDLTDAETFYDNERLNLWATGCRDFAQHGQDFALTRNHHGAGFWDRGYGPIGDRLTESAHTYGEADVIIEDWQD